MTDKPKGLMHFGEARVDLIPKFEECDPGIVPTEYNCIVAPPKPAPTVGRAGLIIAPDDTKDMEELGYQIGRLVAVSPLAFNYARWPEVNGPPQPGDIVWYARHAGTMPFEGHDGLKYRMIKDKDIGAILPEGED